MTFCKHACASLACTLLFLGALVTGTASAVADQSAVSGDLLSARMSGPHLFVGEQYDISGGVIRAVSLPIVGGLLQPKADAVYNVSTATLTTRPNGFVLSSSGAEIDTLSPTSGQIVNRLTFQPVNKNLFPSPTELHVDAAGRIYVAFYYQSRNEFHSALAIYAAGASGNQPPYAILPISGGFATGIATRGDAVYVSDAGRGTIDIFAPVEKPQLAGQIRGFKRPAGLAFDGKGELYACNSGEGTVLAFSPAERGIVHPDRVISVAGHRLCSMSQQFFGNGNELAVSAETLYVAANNTQSIFELRAGLAGPQTPLAAVALPRGNQPWHGIDLAVGPR